MIKRLNNIYLKQRFIINSLSLFINPFYLIRRDLYININKFAPQLRGKLLDFGCGSKPYRTLFNVHEYIGVDIEESGHKHIGDELATIDVFYDGKKLPFESNTFDSVFSSEVFEHVFNLPEILFEINRVMKPGAKLLITVPFVWEEHEKPYDFARYSSFGISHLLETHGFQVSICQKSGNFITVLFQLWCMYLHDCFYTKNKYMNLLINLLIIAPFSFLGLVFNKILPSNYELYHNNVVLAKKINI